MNTIAEIESAIEKLTPLQIEQLAKWLDQRSAKRLTPPSIEGWLQRSRGAAAPGTTTAAVMALTRGDE